jgi:hypothetical protein
MSTFARITMLFAVLAMLVRALPVQGQTDEAAAKRIPWSGYWFPTAKGELLEPLRKYDALTGSSAFQWEVSRNPPGANVPAWHGYCHGWAAAAVLEQEPTQGLMATARGGNISLGVADQKGWYAACHTGDAANWFGDRYGDGQGSEDPHDLRPDVLWQLLKMFIKDQGVPLIMDLDPGPEVWNYPVYAYRVEYQPHPNGGGWQSAQLSLWAADDAVPPDFVGLMPHFQTYTFQFLTRGTAVVAGSASWIGQSVQDHPDFAWYPFVVRPDNPELQYPVVRRLIQGGSPTGPALPPGDAGANGIAAGANVLGAAGLSTTASGTNPSGTPYIPGFHSAYRKPRPGGAGVAPIAGVPHVSSPSPVLSPPAGQSLQPSFAGQPPVPNAGVAPTNGPASAGVVPPNVQPLAAAPASRPMEPVPVSPMQLVASVANRTSQFELDVRLAEFGKTVYAIGERWQVTGNCGQSGYLYLFHINPVGELSLLYPQRANEDNRVNANAAFRFPKAGNYEIEGPLGNHYVKAIVTRQPLILTGLMYETPTSGEARSGRGRSLRLCPTQIKAVQSLLHDYVQGKSLNTGELGSDVAKWLPEFAQDELVFYVGPAKDGQKVSP